MGHDPDALHAGREGPDVRASGRMSGLACLMSGLEWPVSELSG